MSHKTEELVDGFVSKLKALGVAILREDNASRLQDLETKLPKRSSSGGYVQTRNR